MLRSYTSVHLGAWGLFSFLTGVLVANTRNYGQPTFCNTAFVTGYTGPSATTNIPLVPVIGHSYFITNQRTVASEAGARGWVPIHINVQGDMHDYVDSKMAGKTMKVFPQNWISNVSKHTYAYVVWFDNKYNVNVAGVHAAVDAWNTQHAMLMPRHLSTDRCTPWPNCSVFAEVKEAMHQQRYARQQAQIVSYITEQESAGFSGNGHRLFWCTLVVYNMNHAKVRDIQSRWMNEINHCGIEDQISMYFVAQRYPKQIEEYIYAIS